MATTVSAAIFDLDRTLVRGATTPVFQERLRAAGVVDAPNVPFADLLYSTYVLVKREPAHDVGHAERRAGHEGLGGQRRAGGSRSSGRGAARPGAAIRKGLVGEHRAAGRRLVLATTTPMALVRPGRPARLRRRGRHPLGRAGRRATPARSDGAVRVGPGEARRRCGWPRENGVDLEDSYAYSDSFYDGPLLAAVGHPAAINPDASWPRWPASTAGPSATSTCARRGQVRRARAAGDPAPVQPARDGAQRPLRVRRRREHPQDRPGDPGLQPPQLLRLRPRSPSSLAAAGRRPLPRQEGGLRRTRRRPS